MLNASSAPPPAELPALPAPTVSTALAGSPPDTLYVVTSWTPKADHFGPPDAYLLNYAVNGRALPTRRVTRTRDTLRIGRPVCPETTITQVAIIALRREKPAAGVTATRVWRCYDRAPLPVDSIVIDTGAARPAIEDSAEIAAFRDTFPVIVARDTRGMALPTYVTAVGDTIDVCLLARNRFTGQAVTLEDVRDPEPVRQAYANRCERARRAYEAERSG
jgi:hypothetical protein